MRSKEAIFFKSFANPLQNYLLLFSLQSRGRSRVFSRGAACPVTITFERPHNLNFLSSRTLLWVMMRRTEVRSLAWVWSLDSADHFSENLRLWNLNKELWCEHGCRGLTLFGILLLIGRKRPVLHYWKLWWL